MFKNLRALWALVMAFWEDRKGEPEVSGKVISLVTLVIGLLIWIVLVPIVVDQVTSINTDTWNFTGDTGAITLLMLTPFIFIVGGIIYFIKELIS